MNALRMLKHHDFFKDLDEKSIKLLSRIAIPKNFEKGQFVFTQGGKGNALYLLIAGSVQVFKTDPDGREVVVKVLGPGEIFAEVVLFEIDAYPASARVLQETTVLLVPKIQVHCLLADESFRGDFIALLMKKLRYLSERLLQFSAQDVEERFFGFLREHHGQATEFTLAMAKKDLASAIGTNPETLSRLLSRLAAQGRIMLKGKTIRLLKP
jgi:CRP-like cAMP-binding protein